MALKGCLRFWKQSCDVCSNEIWKSWWLVLLEKFRSHQVTTIHPDPIASSHHFPSSSFLPKRCSVRMQLRRCRHHPAKRLPLRFLHKVATQTPSTQVDRREGISSSSFQANTCAARPVYQAIYIYIINKFRLDEQSIIACTLESDSVVQMPIDTLNDIVHNEFPLGTRFPFSRLTWHLKI